MLGAIDFYNNQHIKAWQIIPEKKYFTLDIPDLSAPINGGELYAWRWVKMPFPYRENKNSKVITNLQALQGDSITEAMRWESDQWELFAGHGLDVLPDDVREVPIAVLLSIDDSLEEVIDLDIGKGLWRDNKNTTWKNWN